MNNTNRLCLYLCLLLSTALSVLAQDRAVLRKDSDDKFRTEIVLDTPTAAGTKVLAALYSVDAKGKRTRLKKFSGDLPTPQPADKTVFSIEFPSKPSEDDSFVVSVFELSAASGGILSYDLSVTKLLEVSMRTGRQKCSGGIQLTLRSSDYALKDWKSIEHWANESNKSARIGEVEIVNAVQNVKYLFSSVLLLTSPESALKNSAMLVCLQLDSQLPNQTFAANIKLHSAPTYDLGQPLGGKGLDPAPAPPLPTLADDNGAPGQRGLERNLDAGITFTSAVAEIERANPLTNIKEKIVERTSRGVFDVRLSPWLYLGRKKEFDRNQKLYQYFNPFFMDAAVSTGKIDKDTLSTNRVIFGTEYEWRYYNFTKTPGTNNTKASPYVTTHRFILRGTHASDRDFKQLEYALTFEYQPVLGSLNDPLYLHWRIDEEGRRVAGNFGYEIKPKFGFSLGRTYARRNPAEAIEVSPTLRRFYTGLDMAFSLTRYFGLSISDTFWLRGEAHDDRFHNYFKGTIEAPLGRPFRNSVHSLFLSFERGNEPPFAGRDVNSLKVGYRIRAEGWGGRFR